MNTFFEHFDAFYNGFAVVTQANGKQGMINRNGEVVIAPIYDHIYTDSQGRVRTVLNGKEETVMFVETPKKNATGNGWRPAERDGRYGLIDAQETIILPFIFDEIGGLHENATPEWIAVRMGSEWFYVDRNCRRQFLGEMRVTDTENMGNSMTCIRVKDDYSKGEGAMDETGKFIIPPIYHFIFEEHGVFVVSNEEDEVCGIVDKNNQVLVPMKYGAELPPQDIKEDLWIVEDYDSAKFGVINLNNETVLPFEYDYLFICNSPFANQLCAKKDGKEGIITLEGKTVLPFIYDGIYCAFHDASPNWLVGNQAGKEFYINCHGQKTFGEDVSFLSAHHFRHGLAVVATEYKTPYLKHGVIDTTGKYVIPPIYDDIREIYDDIQEMEGVFLVNIGGQFRYDESYNYYYYLEECDEVSGEYNRGKWGVVDRNNQVLIPIEYDQLNWMYAYKWFEAAKDGKYRVMNLRGDVICFFNKNKYEKIP